MKLHRDSSTRNGVVRKQVALLASSTGSRFTGNALELLYVTFCCGILVVMISARPISVLSFLLPQTRFAAVLAYKIYIVR